MVRRVTATLQPAAGLLSRYRRSVARARSRPRRALALGSSLSWLTMAVPQEACLANLRAPGFRQADLRTNGDPCRPIRGVRQRLAAVLGTRAAPWQGDHEEQPLSRLRLLCVVAAAAGMAFRMVDALPVCIQPHQTGFDHGPGAGRRRRRRGRSGHRGTPGTPGRHTARPSRRQCRAAALQRTLPGNWSPARASTAATAPSEVRTSLSQLGSRAAYDKAIELAGNTAEIAYLTRRRDQLG